MPGSTSLVALSATSIIVVIVDAHWDEKIDGVRDRVSRIEGQLAPTNFVTFNPPTTSKETVRAAHAAS